MLFSRNKPRWLYAAMPGLYLLAGVAVIGSLHNAAGRLSGVLLVAAAIAILVLRVRSRSARAARDVGTGEVASAFAPASRLAATTEFMRTLAAPELGHTDIDRQHRGLAARAATLRVALAHGDATADLELQIHELIDALSHHLDAEVESLARLGVSRAQHDLEADHARLRDAAADLDRYHAAGMSLEALIDRVARTLVAGHLALRHPPLPSMEDSLLSLRQVKTPG